MPTIEGIKFEHKMYSNLKVGGKLRKGHLCTILRAHQGLIHIRFEDGAEAIVNQMLVRRVKTCQTYPGLFPGEVPSDVYLDQLEITPKENTMIKPTVGRKLWYYPVGNQVPQPHDATIVAVNTETSVNLACHDEFGASYAVRGAYLLPSDTPQGIVAYPHAQWMPYQVGQAQAQTQS